MGIINNADALVERYFSDHGHQFMAMSSGKVNATELVAALSSTKGRSDLRHPPRPGRDPRLSHSSDPDQPRRNHCRPRPGWLTSSSDWEKEGLTVFPSSPFAYHKLGYHDAYELGPREIVRITANGIETPLPCWQEMKICAFLWTYYGYPNSNYEGMNVEVMRYRNGEIMARDEVHRGQLPKVDYVAGVPDSGVPMPSALPTAAASPLPALRHIHPHLALLHAHQPGGAQPGGQDEADSRARAH